MSESPFYAKTTVFKKEESIVSSSIGNVLKSIDDAFVKAIPSDDVKSLPPAYLYPVGTLVFTVLVAIFVAVFVPGYLTQVRTQFLAPVGSSNSKYCDSVAISNTGEFLGTKSGIWEGAPGFTFANGSYMLSVTNYQITPEKFEADMADVYLELVAIGKYAINNTLGANLLFWTSWTEVATDSLAQRFAMSGTPLAILNRGITVGTVSSVHADCNAPGTSSFNPSSGIMQVVYQISQFESNPNCSVATPPSMFGYRRNSDTFAIGFDVRSVFTCVAVNSHIIKTNYLQITAQSSYTYHNTSYFIAAYVDPRYPGMKPIQCLFPNGSANSPVCLLIIGSVYVLPVFNHGGYSFSMPVPCNCTGPEELMHDIHTNPYSTCNVFNFLTGFIFYPLVMDPTPLLDLLFQYPNQTGKTINELSFTAMFTAGMWGQESPNRTLFDSPQQREDMYAFCNNTVYGPCSIVTFTSVDESSTATDWVVSTSYYQLKTGACSDSFSTSPEAWNTLVSQPFAPLTQQYETCSNNPTTAFFNQAGVSAGNVSILSPLGVMLVLFLLSCYQMCSGAVIAKSYSRKDKDEALDALAVALLLVRDKKLEQRERSLSHSSNGSLGTHTDALSMASVSASLTEDARLYNTTNNSKKKGNVAKNGRLNSSATYAEERKSRVLTEIVDQLAEIAVVAEQDKQLYQKHTDDPVYIDWAALSRHLRYSLFGAPNKKDLKLRRQESVFDQDYAARRNNTGGDGDVDREGSGVNDVELTTVSEMHTSSVV